MAFMTMRGNKRGNKNRLDGLIFAGTGRYCRVNRYGINGELSTFFRTG